MTVVGCCRDYLERRAYLPQFTNTQALDASEKADVLGTNFLVDIVEDFAS